MIRRRKYSRRAQRRYQRTRYQVPNVITPDELIMTVKMNKREGFVGTKRITALVNGFNFDDIPNYHNLQGNMDKFEQMEILAGSYSVYFVLMGTYSGISGQTNPDAVLIGSYPSRRWVDASLEYKRENVPDAATSSTNMWEELSEIPGYKINFLQSQYSSHGIKKLRWKASKKNWRTLKANPTSWQMNLPLVKDPNNTENNIYPGNVMTIYYDVSQGFGTPAGDSILLSAFTSSTLLVRFKGRKTS